VTRSAQRWRSHIAVFATVLVLTGCSLTEDRHFAVSRSSAGGLTVWFVNCYNAPTSVSLQEADSGDFIWLIREADPASDSFPTRVDVGARPEGYDLVANVQSTEWLKNDKLELDFGGGEAWGERLTFSPKDLPSNGDVLTFDGRIMSPEQFSSQSCDERT
jgi:hypothetical protein